MTLSIFTTSSIEPQVRERLFARSQADFATIATNVQHWINRIKTEGDAAILDYLRTFDQRDGQIGWKSAESFSPDDFRVSKQEIAEATARVPEQLRHAIVEQVKLSANFHNKLAETLTTQWQIEQTPGVVAGYRRVPVDAAGLYVPAGKAPLPTVAQILTVAAKAAGVPKTVVVFPPTDQTSEDAIIFAAVQAGADELYRVGGIAAIAGLAFGTETLPKVAKIAGPGNLYVQAAKFFVSDRVGIDMIAGPSEALFIADETADVDTIALDLLAQCEHGPDSAGLVVTTSTGVAEQIQQAVERHLENLERATYAKKAIEKYSAILVVESENELIDLVNEYAPEHLEIQTRDAEALSKRLNNVGSVFLGVYSPVAAGDYATGTNHTLPTGGAARYASAVSPETFLRTVQFQELTQNGVKSLFSIVEPIATAEGLIGHLDSVRARLGQE